MTFCNGYVKAILIKFPNMITLLILFVGIIPAANWFFWPRNQSYLWNIENRQSTTQSGLK